MLEGIYNNAANLNMLERWQASISQNLASSQASGFKRSQFSVNSEPGAKAESSGSTATSLPKSQNRIDLSAGANRRTENNTDIAIDGPGFFQIQGQNGRMLYTRSGEFHFNTANSLVTSSGQPLMGEGGPIVVDPDKGAMTIAKDGTITQGADTLGRLPLYDFAKGEADLTQIPGGFMAKDGVSPTVVEKPSMIQGAVEGSNVSPITEMINLIMVSNAYQSSQKLITSHDTLMGQAIQTLGAPPVA
ncbi:MAG: flagellar hook basal-body protein [Verrucomicrobiae bacterium]